MLQAFFQALVITLREGFEAFLIVAISLAYLRKSGRSRLMPAVHWGIASTLNSMSDWRRGWTRVSHARSLLVRRKEERAAGSIRGGWFVDRSKRSSEAGASATQPRRRSRLRR